MFSKLKKSTEEKQRFLNPILWTSNSEWSWLHESNFNQIPSLCQCRCSKNHTLWSVAQWSRESTREAVHKKPTYGFQESCIRVTIFQFYYSMSFLKYSHTKLKDLEVARPGLEPSCSHIFISDIWQLFKTSLPQYFHVCKPIAQVYGKNHTLKYL